MWCKKCEKETPDKKCNMCGSSTLTEAPIEVYWCEECNTPIIKKASDIGKNICTLCGSSTKYMCSDLRPVFPEERLLIELLILLNCLSDKFFSSNILSAIVKYCSNLPDVLNVFLGYSVFTL